MSKLTVLNKSDFAEDLAEHPFILWLSKHQQTLIYTFLACVAVLIVAYRFFSNQAANTEAAYLQADIAFERFQDNTLKATEPSSREEAFAQLQSMMKQYPHLQSKYDGLIAETLIIDGNAAEAEIFAHRSFERTKEEDSPFYADFAKTTLLITRGSYEAANKESRELKTRMEAQTADAQSSSTSLSFGPTLFLLNLVRMGMLEQQLGNKKEELNVWEEVKSLMLNRNQYFSPTVNLFNEGRASLERYIDHRINILKN